MTLLDLTRLQNVFTLGNSIPKYFVVTQDTWMDLREKMVERLGVPYTDPNGAQPNLYWRGTLVVPYEAFDGA